MNVQPSRGEARLRVLHLITNFGLGGTERQLVELVRFSDRTWVDIHVACFRKKGPLLRLVEGVVPVTEFPIRRLYHPQTMARALLLAGYLRRQRIDVVHTHGLYPNIFGGLASALGGGLVHVAGIRDQGHDDSPAKSRLQRLVCASAHVVVNAQAIRARLVQEGYDATRVSVIRNGLDLDRLTPACTRGTLRSDLGFAPDAPVVGIAGRIRPVKWVEGFIQAASRVARDVPEARFVIIGGREPGPGGVYETRLRELTRRLGLDERIKFMGEQKDVSSLLVQLNMLVLCSTSEGLPNSVLEAQAVGLPVVVTSVGGLPEIVEHGVTGLVVPPRDVGALSAAVVWLLKERRQGQLMGLAGHQRICTHFGVQRLVNETQELYLKLLRTPPLDTQPLARRQNSV